MLDANRCAANLLLFWPPRRTLVGDGNKQKKQLFADFFSLSPRCLFAFPRFGFFPRSFFPVLLIISFLLSERILLFGSEQPDASANTQMTYEIGCEMSKKKVHRKRNSQESFLPRWEAVGRNTKRLDSKLKVGFLALIEAHYGDWAESFFICFMLWRWKISIKKKGQQHLT